MIVYRYFNLIHGLEALQTGKWKIGRMSELNDPFDCRPQMIHVPDGTPGGPEFKKAYLDQLVGQFGVLCYSAVIHDPVIWSHYAESHRGIALGFDFETTTWFPLKVNYGSTPPVLDFREVQRTVTLNDMENTARLFQQGFTKKAPSWSYEEEYRHFINLDACDMEGTNYFRGVPMDNLKEVVIGARCPVTMRDIYRIISTYHVKRLVEDELINLPRPRILQCRINESSYDLSLEALPQPPA